MEKESKNGFLNRIILSEKEDNNSFEQENEYDLQYMINDFLQENTNNNINNNIKIIQNKYNIYNINSSKNNENKNNKEIENEKNCNISIDFPQINKERNIYDKIVDKNLRKKNFKKILAHKSSISVNSDKNYSEISIFSRDLNNENNEFKKAKSYINRFKKNNKHSYKKYSILKIEDNLKNNTFVFDRIRNKVDKKKYEKIEQKLNRTSLNQKGKKIDMKNIFNQLKIFQNILNKLFSTQFEKEIKEQKDYKDIIYKKIIENYSSKNDITSNSLMKKGKEEEILNRKINNLYNQLLTIIYSSTKEKIDENIFIEVLKLLLASSNYNKNRKIISSKHNKGLSRNDILLIQKNVKEFIEKYSYYNELNNNKNKKNYSIKDKEKGKINATEVSISQYKNNKKFINILDASNDINHDFLYRRQKIKESKNKDNESKECSFQPKINKIYFIKRNKTMDRNISKNSNIDVKGNRTNNVDKNEIPIYEKLYKQDKEKKDKIKKLIKEKLIKEEIKALEECTFKPSIISNNSYAKSFNTNNLPKGYNEYKYKLRKVIADEQKRKIEENK